VPGVESAVIEFSQEKRRNRKFMFVALKGSKPENSGMGPQGEG
jgi:hypothetical protein